MKGARPHKGMNRGTGGLRGKYPNKGNNG